MCWAAGVLISFTFWNQSQGGAAASNGQIKAGDQLVAVQGTSVMGMDMDKVLNLIMGGPQVRSSVMRPRGRRRGEIYLAGDVGMRGWS